MIRRIRKYFFDKKHVSQMFEVIEYFTTLLNSLLIEENLLLNFDQSCAFEDKLNTFIAHVYVKDADIDALMRSKIEVKIENLLKCIDQNQSLIFHSAFQHKDKRDNTHDVIRNIATANGLLINTRFFFDVDHECFRITFKIKATR